MLAVMVTAGLCTALLRFIPLQELGMRFRFGTPHMLGLMAAALPMCLLTASVQSCVATLAKSFKEAQTYMGILILAPMIIGVMGTLYPDRQPAVDVRRAAARPVRAAHQRARRLSRPAPSPSSWPPWRVCVGRRAVLRATVALLNDERIVFGR